MATAEAPVVQVEVLVAPTPEQVDAAVLAYEEALADVETLRKVAAERGDKLQKLVTAFGSAPPKTKATKRLEGLRRAAQLTWSTTVTVNEPGVAEFKSYLAEKDLLDTLFPELFETLPPPVYVPPPPKHRRKGDFAKVLAAFPGKLSAAVRGKLALLYSKTTSSRTSEPSLKVVNLEKS